MRELLAVAEVGGRMLGANRDSPPSCITIACDFAAVPYAMPPVIPNPAAIHAFETEADFERWLAKHHATDTEVWIKLHKKSSGLPSITNHQALDVALSWGWIDAIRKSFDDKSFLQRYTPRGKRSIWSQINTDHVARLIKAKRMQAPGFAQIETAKADGRWAKAYAGSKAMVAPDDLIAAIDANPKARAMYDTLNSQNRYALSFRLSQIKTDSVRANRVKEFVAMLARGETIYPNGAAVKKAAKKVATKVTKNPAKRVAPKSATKTVKKSAAPLAKKAAKKTISKKSAVKKTTRHR